ncbi:hypothetical protein SEUCBS140593_005643 [Sporothrix eucalyptigena]|uniref:Zn(2)-C6 fungal-type domain-containing protein n=1 Tax=Sporothrix eucalyptigena TaxID=1812306 RepID=A0ABP0BYK2_9PEZI
MPRPRASPAPSGGDIPNVSCGRCRRRKIRCNRQRPCSQCTRAGEECIFPGGGERQKPAPRRYVQALETRVASLESLLQKVASAGDDVARSQLLASVGVDHVVDNVDTPIPTSSTMSASTSTGLPMLADAAAMAGAADQPSEAREVQVMPDITASNDINASIAETDDTSETNDINASIDEDAVMINTPPSSSACSVGASGNTANGATADLGVARAREGRLRKLTGRKATQFYGGTSLFQLQLSESRTGPVSPSATVTTVGPTSAPTSAPTPPSPPVAAPTTPTPPSTGFPYPPRGDMCRQLLAYFFQNVYQYYFCVYREYFLRDYAAGSGPYYSDMLLFCLCAVAARISPQPERQALAPVFVERAESLLLASLHQPELTTLQSLLMLAQIEIGQGRGSKGWLFCGMACRLTHEMGLHLDPTNWTGTQQQQQHLQQAAGSEPSHGRPTESSVDREILRRVYWAAFTVDKQLSLYFGRPPALYPHEADVRNTIRIPYPSEWESLIDTYISPGTSATAFEDSVSVAGTFIHHAELAKVLHALIVDVFENRRGGDSNTTKKNDDGPAVQHVHERLVRWQLMLPQKLHWSPWTTTTTAVTATGRSVAPYILHLHLVFHTAMIILHRPLRRHLDDPAAAPQVIASEDVEICYESLAAILRLLRTYTRQHHEHHNDQYRLALLPLDIVHTLSTAAGVVLMRRHLERLAWTDRDVALPLNQLLDAMRAVQPVYPCMTEILDAVVDAVATGRAQDLEREQRAAARASSGLGSNTTSPNNLSGSLPDTDLGVMHILNSSVGINTIINTLPPNWNVPVTGNGGGAGGSGESATIHTDESPPNTEADTTLGFLVTDDFLNGVGDFDWGTYQ